MAKKGLWGGIMSLVVTSDDDQELPPPSLTASVEPEPEPEPEPPPVEVAPALIGSSEIVEGRPHDVLYQAAMVPSSPYPVEKLLAVIEGLAAMPPEQIRMCVAAMDAADNTWTVEDPVLDAKNKIGTLDTEKKRLGLAVERIEGENKSEAERADQELAATAADIKGQIEALQAKLHEAIGTTQANKATLEAKTRAAREAAARESVRLTAEIGRLQRVPNTFGSGLPDPSRPSALLSGSGLPAGGK